MNAPQPDLPHELLREWQEIVDLVARLAQVRVSLVMRVSDQDIEVLVASRTPCNPYHPGEKEALHGSGLYCEEVIRSNDCLQVANASLSERWQHNPDMKHGLISYLGFPIRLPDGRPFGTLCLLDDKENVYSVEVVALLEKMRNLAEQHLRFAQENRFHRIFANESLLRQILENLPIPIAVSSTRDEWEILFMNKQFTATFGYTPADLPSIADWLSRIFPDPRMRDAASMRWRSNLLHAADGTGTIVQREVRAVCKDGATREVLISNITIDDITIMSLIDITAQKQIEQAMKQALETAEAASSAKSDFLGRVSHDLRSPLTAIIGFSQLLSASGGQVTRQAKIIHRSARHMLNLVNDLIDYAVSKTGGQLDESPMYVLGVLDSIALEARMLAQRRNNRFRLDIRDDLPPVLTGDAVRIRRILLNLLDNAAKFTTDGLIVLEVGARAAPDRGDTLLIEFTIRDNGCGMPLADQHKVFEPFVRLQGPDRSNGSGLGLSIVQALVTQMGGELVLSSRPGAGTEVRVCLPLRTGSEAAMSEHQILDVFEQLPEPDGGGRLIWLVEDSDEIRRLLQDALEGVGFMVRSAADGQAFIDRIQGLEAQPPALVLTDYLMPRADGAAVLAAVRRCWPAVPVVLLSATQQSMESIELPASRGFAACLMKPINLGELYLTIARLLGLQAGIQDGATPEQPAGDEDLPEGAGLPDEAVRTIRRMVEMGAVTDLQEYAEALARRTPACRELALRVQALAASSDLDALSALTGAA